MNLFIAYMRTELKIKEKWCFHAKIYTRLHFNHEVIFGDITVYISHFEIYLKHLLYKLN